MFCLICIISSLQNLNIKRDTLEKRTFIPDHFKPRPPTIQPPVHQITATPQSDSAFKEQGEIHPDQYNNQYLPSSLRNNHNPFSIVASTTTSTENIPDGDKQVISSVLGTGLSNSTQSLAIAPAPLDAASIDGGNGNGNGNGSSELQSADYNSAHKEITVL